MVKRSDVSTLLPNARQLPFLYLLMTVSLITTVLYWAQEVIIPLALAIFLAFLLAPLVTLLQRYRLRRIPAVIIVVALTFTVLAGIGWTVFRQMTSLMAELPHYEDNIKGKISDLRGMGKSSILEKVQTASKEMMEELQKEYPQKENATPPTPELGRPMNPQQTPAADENPAEPVPVVVQGPSLLWQLPTLFEQLATAGLVMLLVFFILIDRGDLRNRIIRLIGLPYLTTTTKALDDASHRVSRYLLMQTLINSTFGVAVGLVLFFLGLPHAFLWGLLATALRFIPYVGVIIAILLPTILSLAVFPGWTKPLLIFGILSSLEGINNMFLETLLYGQSIGVSAVPLIIAFAFWTWLWGPVGLLLATPLTVSIVVLGKYVPQLAFFDILMGDEPVLQPEAQFYQRLLAQDQDEATAIMEHYLQTHALAETYDEVILPALYRTRRDALRHVIEDEDQRFVLEALREILDDLYSTVSETAAPVEEHRDHEPPGMLPTVKALTLPVHGAVDEVALHMLVHLLDPAQFTLEQLPPTSLASEVVAMIVEKQASLICLGAVAPGGLAKVRYLCKRLRARLPHLKIIVGHWGEAGDSSQNLELLKDAGADYISSTLQETCKQLQEASRLLAFADTAADSKVASLPSSPTEVR